MYRPVDGWMKPKDSWHGASDPLSRKGHLGRPVHRIAQKGMADTGHMDADLVGPAGFQGTLDIRVLAQPFQNLVVGHGRTALSRVYRHFFPSSSGRAADRERPLVPSSFVKLL